GLISGCIALGAAEAGSFTTKVTVTDGVYSNSLTFTWTVHSPISFTAIANQTKMEGATVSLLVQASSTSSASLTFSAQGLPNGLCISSNGLISGTIHAGAAANGPFVSTITATDGTYT